MTGFSRLIRYVSACMMMLRLNDPDAVCMMKLQLVMGLSLTSFHCIWLSSLPPLLGTQWDQRYTSEREGGGHLHLRWSAQKDFQSEQGTLGENATIPELFRAQLHPIRIIIQILMSVCHFKEIWQTQ